MISESGSVEAMLRSPGFPAFSAAAIDHQRVSISVKIISPAKESLKIDLFSYVIVSCKSCKLKE